MIERLQNNPASVVEAVADEEATRLWDSASGKRDIQVMFVLGAFYAERYNRTGIPSDQLDSRYFLFAVYSRAESALPKELQQHFASLRRATRAELADWSGRAMALATSFAESGDMAEIEQAIDLFRQITAATATEYPTYANDLANLCAALIDRFKCNGNQDGLREAVAIGREASRLDISRFDQVRALVLSNFASAANLLCSVEPDEALLELAVTMAREAAGSQRPGDLYRSHALMALSGGLQQLYQLHGGEASLHEAVAVARTALGETSGTDRQYAMAAANLSVLLLESYWAAPSPELLSETAAAGRVAVAATPLSHPSRADRMALLLRIERIRYQMTDTRLLPQLLEDERHDATTPERLSALAYGLTLSYLREKNTEAMSESVEVAQRVLRSVPTADLGRKAYAFNLSSILGLAYEVIREPSILERALQLCREADHLLARDIESHIDYLVLLTELLRLRYVLSGDQENLRDSIRVAREALAMKAHPEAQAAAFGSLGLALRSWFERTGQISVLRESIDCGRSAVELSGNDSNNYGLNQMNLGNALMQLYRVEETAESLEDALGAYSAALAKIPPGDHARDKALGNMAEALFAQYKRTRDPVQWREARRMAEEAIAETPVSSAEYALHLSNLANYLSHVPEEDESAGGARLIVDLYRRALEATPETHTYRGRYLSNLSIGLTRQYLQTGRDEFLSEALETSRQAVDITVEDRPERALYVMNLADVLRVRFEATGEPGLLDEAISTSVSVAVRDTMPIILRLRAAREAAALAASEGRMEQGLALYDQAIQFLPLVIPRAFRRDDRRYRLGAEHSLGSDAAAVALSLGQVQQAVEILEQTRGIMLSEAINLRGDIAQLKAEDDELAAEFVDLRERLSSPQDLEPQARRDLAEQWDALVARIRSREGFSRFLLPPLFAELNVEAAHGPVVLVNASTHGCDAIIVTGEEPRVVSLETTLEIVLQVILGFTAARLRAMDPQAPLKQRSDANKDMRRILAWLWNTITRPVFDAIGFDFGRQLPRLWWCPIGVMAFLPLHAAADNDTAHPESVLDRAVCSYTPTIRALGHARQQRATGIAEGDSPLIVAMPHTPGARDLPGVVKEIAAIRELAGPVTLLEGADATSPRVRDAMPRHAISHFACHGVSDWDDPDASRLLLHDHVSNPLTVAAISQLRLSGSRLAYLSACSTSDQPIQLADEALHITGAFQLAGYPQVIGSLWPVFDSTNAVLCSLVYSHMRDVTSGKINPDGAARALHEALRTLRSNASNAPAIWAAYIHVGA